MNQTTSASSRQNLLELITYWKGACETANALLGETLTTKDAEIKQLKHDLQVVVGLLQRRLQPGGSPPPGGVIELAEWITAAARDEIERLKSDLDSPCTNCLGSNDVIVEKSAAILRLTTALREAWGALKTWVDACPTCGGKGYVETYSDDGPQGEPRPQCDHSNLLWDRYAFFLVDDSTVQTAPQPLQEKYEAHENQQPAAVEPLLHTQEVTGSSPVAPTTFQQLTGDDCALTSCLVPSRQSKTAPKPLHGGGAR